MHPGVEEPGGSPMDWSRTGRNVAGFAALVAVGVGVLYLRDPHSLLLPTLYTEDGAWMAMLFNRGFWHTLIHAKGGETPYFVTLNILLLQAAKSLNAVCYGASLAHLPQFVSALAMTFYGVLAAAPVWLLRGRLTASSRGLLWLLVIFMPLGESSFEILGRVSNIGYGLLVLCVCLLAWRRAADRGHVRPIMAADAAVFVCAVTNPLCFPVIAADYALRGLQARRSGVALAAMLRCSAAARSAAVLAVALGCAVAGMATLEPRPSPFLRDRLDADSLIEAVIARPLLFPLLFPIYGRLDDGAAVTIAVGMVMLAWWLTREAPATGRFVLATGLTSWYAAMATVAVRPGLTVILDEYSTTRIDRYYYGTSLLVAVAACAAISAGRRAGSGLRRGVAAACMVLIVVVYATHGDLLQEFRRSRWRDVPQHDFVTAVVMAAATAQGEHAGRVQVQLHPRGWQARFPAANVRATAVAAAEGAVRR